MCSGHDVSITSEPLASLLGRTDVAMVTSGTATLETALAGVPMVIAYKTSFFTYALLKSMIRIPFIGLPNIVAGEKIVAECIQGQATGTHLAKEIKKLIDSDECYRSVQEKLFSLREKLGEKKPSEEMAEAIIKVCWGN
jgi:lipid-A-disaccharide synthase